MKHGTYISRLSCGAWVWFAAVVDVCCSLLIADMLLQKFTKTFVHFVDLFCIFCTTTNNFEKIRLLYFVVVM